jgi:hypothetical protein
LSENGVDGIPQIHGNYILPDGYEFAVVSRCIELSSLKFHVGSNGSLHIATSTNLVRCSGRSNTHVRMGRASFQRDHVCIDDDAGFGGSDL